MAAVIRAGYILRARAQTNAGRFFLDIRLPVTRKPLIIKNTSTAIEPKVMPRLFLRGSALLDPIDNAKLWLNKTADAAIMRSKLKLLSLFPVKFDSSLGTFVITFGVIIVQRLDLLRR